MHASGLRHSGDACRAAGVDRAARSLWFERRGWGSLGRAGPCDDRRRDDSSAELAGSVDVVTAADSADAFGRLGVPVRVRDDERRGASGGPCADAADLARAVDASGA